MGYIVLTCAKGYRYGMVSLREKALKNILFMRIDLLGDGAISHSYLRK